MTAPLTARELLPCPFCGGGETIISEQRLRPRMDGKEPALVSVTLRHWCGPQPGVVASHIEYRGRDHESAIAAWNRRAALDGGEWQGIESAPRDGTYVDLWIDGRRWADCYWGFPEHCCGEAGQYCDSDWHSLGPGWVESTFNLPIDAVEQEPTHWRHLPVPPTAPQEASPDDV